MSGISSPQGGSKDGEKTLSSLHDPSSSPKRECCWTSKLRMLPITMPPNADDTLQHDTTNSSSNNNNNTVSAAEEERELEVNIASFNVLADSYLNPRSHPHLPHAKVVFDRNHRRALLVSTIVDKLIKQCGLDILCLQEVDTQVQSAILPPLSCLGFDYVHASRLDASNERCVDSPTDNNDSKSRSLSDNATTTDGSISEVCWTKVKKTSMDEETDTKTTHKHKRTMDECFIVWKVSKWTMIQSEVIRFDDMVMHSSDTEKSSPPSAVTGMIKSYQRHNLALVVILEETTTTVRRQRRKICVVCTHLYWNPAYEYVKLSQVKYLLHRVHSFAPPHVPVILCGDLNSKPNSIVYQFLVHGVVDARLVAPWHFAHQNDSDADDDIAISNSNNTENADLTMEKTTIVSEKKNECPMEKTRSTFTLDHNLVTQTLTHPLSVTEQKEPANDETTNCREARGDIDSNENNMFHKLASLPCQEGLLAVSQKYNDRLPTVKYLLDFTLNRFTRWLRILGLDAALETQQEEQSRTRDGNIVLFERCRVEKRTLITTSYKLLLRKDCPPGAYLVNPKKPSDLESTLVHLLLLHGITLDPCQFLTRCVVCNGSISDVLDPTEQRCIFEHFGSPLLDVNVYKCDGCGQGYWWSEEPTSSSSRVKDAATHLFRICLRGGVPIVKDDQSSLLDFIDTIIHVEEERSIGLRREQNKLASLDDQKDLSGDQSKTTVGLYDVVAWLKDEKLQHPYCFRSAYASSIRSKEREAQTGELLPFTNVTSGFVGTLDYIFYQPLEFTQTGRMYVPTTFRDLNNSNYSCNNNSTNGHVLPSNVWPSDHLAVGARLRFLDPTSSVDVTKKIAIGSPTMIDCLPTTTKMDDPVELGKIQAVLPMNKGETYFVEDKTENCVVGLQSLTMNGTSPSLSPMIVQDLCTPIIPSTVSITGGLMGPPHASTCACGCIPKIHSLFEMAELRKQYRLGKKLNNNNSTF